MRVTMAIAAAALVLSVLPAQAQSCTDTSLKPVMETHTIPPYPPVSKSTNEEGATVVKVLIGTDGAVKDASVATSSGAARLDEAAVDYVKANWRWQAPTKNCKPVEAQTMVQIKWSLEDSDDDQDAEKVISAFINAAQTDYPPDALQRRETGWTAVMALVQSDGSVGRVDIARSSGFDDLDQKAILLVRSHSFAPATMDGKPVTSVLDIMVGWSPDGKPLARPGVRPQ